MKTDLTHNLNKLVFVLVIILIFIVLRLYTIDLMQIYTAEFKNTITHHHFHHYKITIDYNIEKTNNQNKL